MYDYDYCNSLVEVDVWAHDENCYFPELRCAALTKAAEALRRDKYVVETTYVDLGGTKFTVGCFDTIEEATSFFDSYDGCGDYLRCTHGDEVILFKDLWLVEEIPF